jgi:hypothetical protein
LPGLLVDVEEAVSTVASAKSIEAAADMLRGVEVTLPSAVRWLRRRVHAVQAVLDAVLRLMPETAIGPFASGTAPHIRSVKGM